MTVQARSSTTLLLVLKANTDAQYQFLITA
jgi:hypothetical protein